MFIVHSLGLAICLCIVTMLGWGSWANTQKLAGKDRWPFQLYYWDWAIGVFLFAWLAAFTIGSTGDEGMPVLANLQQAGTPALTAAFLSGALFNLSNILLVVAIDAAGMAVAFPVGVGLALVIGTVSTYLQTPKGNAALLFAGVAFVVVAMITSSIARSKMAKLSGTWQRGIAYAVIAGCLMGFFYPQLLRSISPEFSAQPIQPGLLTPYAALALFGTGVLASNFLLNTIFMRAANLTYGDYFKGSSRLHAIGVLGGIIWTIALVANVIASGKAGGAISYALGQGATLVASIWGVFVWKEFAGAPAGTGRLIAAMFAAYALGLILIGMATL
jgi:glucose uptake protein